MAKEATVEISDLPSEIDIEDAVESCYGPDMNWAVEKLLRGSSVLLECDKAMVQFLYLGIRSRLRTAQRMCRLIDGRRVEGPGSLVQKTISDLAATVQEVPGETVLVLPHLDLVTTTTRSGLTAEAREAIVWFYENPEITFLAFKDATFELPEVVSDLFPAQRSFAGIPRPFLPKVVLQKEARKFAFGTFRPYSLYKYVSGLNVLKLRRILEQFHDHRDFDPATPETAQAILRDIRASTVQSSMDLPQVDLEKDIGGYAKVKAQLRRDLLDLYAWRDAADNQQDIEQVEGLLPKGIIFEGPPGTGKTFFAKALATALDATLQVVSGPELKSKWVGESEANLRRVFQQARESAPSIIVFDELDSFATSRGTYASGGVEHSMVNQLLTEMDGFHKDETVLVIGTTNFHESLDPALLRPGRFELQITIPYPGDADRKAILECYRKKFGFDMSDEVLDEAVRMTQGYVNSSNGTRFSGDHLYAICRSLQRNQLREGKHEIAAAEVQKVIENESDESVVLNTHEEHVVACHEMGHAIVAAVLEHSPWPEKITITPEGQGLGYVIQEVKQNRYVTTEAELKAQLAVCMGGRAGEEVLVKEVGVGAASDLEKANEIATLMVEELGLGKGLGGRTFRERTASGAKVRKKLPPKTEEKVDQAIQYLLDEALETARETCSKYKSKMVKFIEILKEKKTIEGDEFKKLCKEAKVGTDHH